MRRPSSSTVGHPGAIVMPGIVVVPLTAPDRLHMYRRCFHELEEQVVMLQAKGQDTEVQKLQAESRFLEELIMVFTELNFVPPNKQSLTHEVRMPDSADRLDLSLVTDILMLSATSPWTVYIADRNQWLLCFVSPSVKQTTGWTSQELLGTAAWGACHSDDVPMVQRMLHLRDSETFGGSVIYRRLRKDRLYVTVQATGRAIGTRWYAWVEQNILNFSPETHREELQANQTKGVPRSSKFVKADISGTVRAQRQSAPWTGVQEVPNLNWDQVGRGHKSFFTNVATVPISPQTNTTRSACGSPVSSLDEPLAIKSITSPKDLYLLEPMQVHNQSQEAMPMMTTLNTELEQNGATFVPIKSNYTEIGDRASKVAKGKAIAQENSNAPPSSSSNQRVDAPPIDGLELLQNKKVLLAEDDVVNRKVGHRLLLSINCDVTVVCDGQKALDILCKEPSKDLLTTNNDDLHVQFDLVLMDLQMPIMDGTIAVKRFREWEELQEPPRKRLTIFALTANVSDSDMVKCAQSGFDEFISKPLTIETLLERLKIIKNNPINKGVLDLYAQT